MKKNQDFINKWSESGGAERANYAVFISELCNFLEVEPPLSAKGLKEQNHYRFDRPVAMENFNNRKENFINLYKKGCFILETKQGLHRKYGNHHHQSNFSTSSKTIRTGQGISDTIKYDINMEAARAKADRYARAIAKSDGRPPFLIVCDVGSRFDIYADFSEQGHYYAQFPNCENFSIHLSELAVPEKRELLRQIWDDPQSLDGERKKTTVTIEIANHLVELIRSFEGKKHDPEIISSFLMRCLFCMFAEDVDLIPNGSFTALLYQMHANPVNAKNMLENLWQSMYHGDFSSILNVKLLEFNGGIFNNSVALPLNSMQIELLIKASEKDWTNVEPSIFGTLLEQALDERQRHQLGAHFTPRSYVERLVIPTVIEPLRRNWNITRSSVAAFMEDGKQKEALKEVQKFHENLCSIRVLDPACGSGNFLYVTFELMKKLEGEVTSMMEKLGDTQTKLRLHGHTVDPQQFLGIEINPRASKVAEMVIWIGYLQQHFRTYGTAIHSQPVLRDIANIECRDAILEYDKRIEKKDRSGKNLTRWDGITTITNPVTNKQVPDQEATVPIYEYVNPRPANWQEADFIVGNPPFLGDKRRREFLGDDYSEALKKAYPKIADSTDFVLYWWEKAAIKSRCGKIHRFGFITTSSLSQTFNRRVLVPHLEDSKNPLSIIFAIPNHPWVDCSNGAKVRIAMTVAEAGTHEGRFFEIVSESPDGSDSGGFSVQFDMKKGKIFANLKVDMDVSEVKKLKAQEGLSCLGLMLSGKGFKVSKSKAEALGLGKIADLVDHIKPYANASDLYGKNRGLYLIDMFGISEKDMQRKFPSVYQHLKDNVKPLRSVNRRKSLKENWWIVAEPRRTIRPAIRNLSRFIVTSETPKHLIFQFLPGNYLPDHKLLIIATDDASILSVLSSRIHKVWVDVLGGKRGKSGNVYTKSNCFDTFPFPNFTDSQCKHLRMLGEQLDNHRKAQISGNSNLTLTDSYNVLEKVRKNENLNSREQKIYEQGLIGILNDLHEEIDNAVAKAYGLSNELSDIEIYSNLLEFNKERVREEQQGQIKWLRPDYQIPNTQIPMATTVQDFLDISESKQKKVYDWPRDQTEKLAAVLDCLNELEEASPAMVAKHFKRNPVKAVTKLLEMLDVTGVATITKSGSYRIIR